MNSLPLAILILLTSVHVFEWALSVLNLRYAASRGLPRELEGAYTVERYTQAMDYLGVCTKFSLVHGIVDFSIFVAFWFCSGFMWVDSWTSRLVGDASEIYRGLIFIGILFLFQMVLSLPWSLYKTFVIEARFGFNRTSISTFFMDQAKGLLLGVLIGAPILLLVQWFFVHAGQNAWAWVWGFLTLIQVALLFIAPIFLMPLFFKFTPLQSGALRTAIEMYAKKVGFDLSGIFVIDGSRRSNKANAFFTGFGRTRRIALFDTLVEKSSEEEIVAVLAHEVGHAKRGHVVKGFVLSVFSSGLMFFILGQALHLKEIYDAFFVSQSVYAGLVIVSILYAPISTVFGIFSSMLSRKYEFEADAFAASTANATAMISALKKLSEGNLSNPNPHPWVVALEYSHPPTVARIQALSGFAPASK
jgi:STE24 endopeptidase